jgi:hypothetical protein
MIKIIDIIKEQSSSRNTFTTSQQGVDPETGKISWKVKYHPAKELEKGLENLKDQMELLIKQNPNDSQLAEYYNIFRKYKNSLNTFLNKQYPKK